MKARDLRRTQGRRKLYAARLEHSLIITGTFLYCLIPTMKRPAIWDANSPLRLRSLAVYRTAKAIGHRLNYAGQGGCGHFDAAADTHS